MIAEERIFCLFCRGELHSKDEIQNQYHYYCREEFEKEESELPVYNEEDILHFKEFFFDFDCLAFQITKFTLTFGLPYV